MYESLKTFNNIIVSGPQRSGTRIATRIISHDTGKDYIDEKDINFHDFRLLEWHIARGNSVIQCPGLCHLLHTITDQNTLIIMVRRPLDEILASEWRCWNDKSRLIELFKYGHSEGIISKIKYDYWDKVQKQILGLRAREISYHTLNTHELFVHERSSFRWDQTV